MPAADSSADESQNGADHRHRGDETPRQIRLDRVEEGIGQKLDRVAHDVAYLAGRQAERDQNR